MNYISNILYWISTGLLVPVIILLILLFIRALLLVGSFFGQYLSIKKSEAEIKNLFKDLDLDNIDTIEERLPKGVKTLEMTYIRKMCAHQQQKAQLQRLLSNFEIEGDKDLAISKTLTKMGPMLGLMGTLIPMGPALVGLSTGDIASMAYNMQVAFATTVVGLFSAAIGFVTQQTKQRWYLQSMTNLEFLAEIFIERHKKA